jgi:hypothetical protein
VFCDQVLVNTLRRKAGEQPLLNDLRQRRTLAGPAGRGPGGHNGRF